MFLLHLVSLPLDTLTFLRIQFKKKRNISQVVPFSIWPLTASPFTILVIHLTVLYVLAIALHDSERIRKIYQNILVSEKLLEVDISEMCNFGEKRVLGLKFERILIKFLAQNATYRT
jgi:hypothetical protein